MSEAVLVAELAPHQVVEVATDSPFNENDEREVDEDDIKREEQEPYLDLDHSRNNFLDQFKELSQDDKPHKKKKKNKGSKEENFYHHCSKRIRFSQFHVKMHIPDKGSSWESGHEYLYVYDTDKLERRVLFFDGKIRQISAIELQSETFETTFHFYITYLATAKDVESWAIREKSKLPWKAEWEPKMHIQNNKAGDLNVKKNTVIIASSYSWLPCTLDKTTNYGKIGFDPRLGVWIRVMYEFTGKLLEEFELHSFPFDCQDLSFVIQCKDDVHILPLPTEEVYLNYDPEMSTSADFTVRGVVAEFGRTDSDKSRGGRKYGQAILAVKLQREWKSRLHVILSIAILAFLSLCVFAVDSSPTDGLGDRVNFLMTLILADIALQQSVRERLDDFDYLTALDVFIWLSFMYKVAVLIWVCIPSYPLFNIPWFHGERTNFVATTMFALIYCVYSFFCVVYFATVYHLEKHKLISTSKQLEEEFKNTKRHQNFAIRLKDGEYAKTTDIQRKHKRLVQFGAPERQALEQELFQQQQEQLEDILQEDHELITFSGGNHARPAGRMSFDIRATSLFCFVTIITTVGIDIVFSDHIISIAIILIHVICMLGSLVTAWYYFGQTQGYDHDGFVYVSFLVESALFFWTGTGDERVRTACGTLFLTTMFLLSATIYKLKYDDYFYVGRYVSLPNIDQKEDAGHHHHGVSESSQLEVFNENECCQWMWCGRMGDYWAHSKKYIGYGYFQSFRVVVTSLPLFVLRAAETRISDALQPTDYIAIVVLCFGVVISILTGFFGSAKNTWFGLVKTHDSGTSFHRLFTDVSGRTMVERIRARSDSNMSVLSMTPQRSNTQESAFESATVNGPTAKLATPKQSWLLGLLNPFNYVRYPDRSADILIWIAFWIATIVVYPRFLLGMISSWSPLFVIVYHSLIAVPLLDSDCDHTYGSIGIYQDYKRRTSRISPIYF